MQGDALYQLKLFMQFIFNAGSSNVMLNSNIEKKIESLEQSLVATANWTRLLLLQQQPQKMLRRIHQTLKVDEDEARYISVSNECCHDFKYNQDKGIFCRQREMSLYFAVGIVAAW